MIAVLISLATPDAAAASVFQKVCFKYDANFLDVGNGDDHVTHNNTYKAQNAKYSISEYGGPTVSSGYLNDDGCVSLFLSNTKSYLYVMASQANFGAASIDVHPTRSQAQQLYGHAVGPVTPTGGTYNVTASASIPGNDWVNVMIAWTKTFKRAPAAWPGYSYNLYMEAPSGGGAAAWEADRFYQGTLYPGVSIDPNNVAALYKFALVHELGHAIGFYVNCQRDAACGTAQGEQPFFENESDPCDPTLTGNDLGHDYNSKENQTAAEIEGWAHYVAAFTFNNVGETDCRYTPANIIRWNYDSVQQNNTAEAFSCEGGEGTADNDYGGAEFTDPVIAVEGRDAFGQFCAGSGDVANRGMEVDWLRFWWDVHQTSGVTLDDILAIRADMGTNGWSSLDTAPASLKVNSRVAQAFYANGLLSVWAAQNNNGITR
ncbi:MAG: hypothetical protein H6737_26575 [Alphaproteobacteria bacterium]|nr:hypothetical protein [Alphaproteobacteria bacterium]